MIVKGVVKQWRFPEASERQFSRSIQEAIRELVVLMRKRTKAMKFDATDNEIYKQLFVIKKLPAFTSTGSKPTPISGEISR